ncbi:MAG: peptide ABC transporter substrate-binding protein [Gemmatimonadota bacterium]
MNNTLSKSDLAISAVGSSRLGPACIETIRQVAIGMIAALAVGCSKTAKPCDRCDLLVIAATGEPETLLPPAIGETVGRDISDLVFERLASLKPGASPVDDAGFEPRLAARWDRVDSLTWRVHLRPGATWHDGQPVTARDVQFSFEAYQDTTVYPSGAGTLDRLTVSADDDSTVSIRFKTLGSENRYDGFTQVRVLPRHIWEPKPRAGWVTDTSRARLIGSGPFKVIAWDKGTSLTLERTGSPPPGTARRIVWRFTHDQDAAVNLLLSGEADLVETITSPSGRERVAGDTALRRVPYASAVYGFLGFRLANPVLADVRIRRALTHGLDRATIARSVFGEGVAVPPGPMSRALWIWSDSIKTLGFDTAGAALLLDEAGWRRGPDGVRARGGRPLSVDILIPSTSASRRQLAQAIQESWRRLGVSATVTAVDFPVFQERTGKGKFDSFIGAWADEPSPRALKGQWTASGLGGQNQTGYASARFDSLLDAASAAPEAGAAGRLWREAMDTLNADAPAVWLYALQNMAVMRNRMPTPVIDPFSWLTGAEAWKISRPPR